MLALLGVARYVSRDDCNEDASDPLAAVTSTVINVLEPDGVKMSVTADAVTHREAATDWASSACFVEL